MTAIGLVRDMLSELYSNVHEFVLIPETDLTAHKKKAVAIIALIDKDMKKTDKIQQAALLPLLNLLESEPEGRELQKQISNLSSHIRAEANEAIQELKKILKGYRDNMEVSLKLIAEGALGLKDQKIVIRALTPSTPHQEEIAVSFVTDHLDKVESFMVKAQQAVVEYANA